MTLLRAAMMPPMRGNAIFDISAYSKTKLIASQTSCDGKCSDSNGGNAGFPAGASVCALVSAIGSALKTSLPQNPAVRLPATLQPEQQQKRDQQRENAERFGDGEA